MKETRGFLCPVELTKKFPDFELEEFLCGRSPIFNGQKEISRPCKKATVYIKNMPIKTRAKAIMKTIDEVDPPASHSKKSLIVYLSYYYVGSKMKFIFAAKHLTVCVDWRWGGCGLCLGQKKISKPIPLQIRPAHIISPFANFNVVFGEVPARAEGLPTRHLPAWTAN